MLDPQHYLSGLKLGILRLPAQGVTLLIEPMRFGSKSVCESSDFTPAMAMELGVWSRGARCRNSSNETAFLLTKHGTP
jgi:hypothetical protein